MHDAEAARLRALSPEDGLRELVSLCREFSEELETTEPFFRSRRLAHLQELQAQLARLNEAR